MKPNKCRNAPSYWGGEQNIFSATIIRPSW